MNENENAIIDDMERIHIILSELGEIFISQRHRQDSQVPPGPDAISLLNAECTLSFVCRKNTSKG